MLEEQYFCSKSLYGPAHKILELIWHWQTVMVQMSLYAQSDQSLCFLHSQSIEIEKA